MTHESEKKLPVILLIALVLLVIPLFIQGFWITVFSMDSLESPAAKSDYYLNHFPMILRNSYTLVYIAFFSSLAVFILSAMSLGRMKNNLKWIAYISVALSFLVGCLSLFQLM
jgi:hypothetical protein